MAPSKSVHLSLAPGQSIEVVSIGIDPQRTSCNAALPAGKYQLGFSVQTSHRVCGGTPPGVIDIPNTKPAAPLPQFVPEAGPSCPPGHTCG
ncbi:MAG TPA: hypothetical protein VHW01_18125 [Polyangiaceae bacterium]|nr:hypothetical protein [Polyangiaceae bacterium]